MTATTVHFPTCSFEPKVNAQIELLSGFVFKADIRQLIISEKTTSFTYNHEWKPDFPNQLWGNTGALKKNVKMKKTRENNIKEINVGIICKYLKL